MAAPQVDDLLPVAEQAEGGADLAFVDEILFESSGNSCESFVAMTLDTDVRHGNSDCRDGKRKAAGSRPGLTKFQAERRAIGRGHAGDRKSTRLNSSH